MLTDRNDKWRWCWWGRSYFEWVIPPFCVSKDEKNNRRKLFFRDTKSDIKSDTFLYSSHVQGLITTPFCINFVLFIRETKKDFDFRLKIKPAFWASKKSRYRLRNASERVSREKNRSGMTQKCSDVAWGTNQIIVEKEIK